MGKDWGWPRWLVIGLVVTIGVAGAALLALRPMIATRPPRWLSRRADDALYNADPPDISAPLLPADPSVPDYLEGTGSSVPPEGYPVKGNRRSGIYHIPGDLAYERTVPTLWFRTPEAAERAGFRHALR
jgi:hypothetical protein